MFSFLNPKNWGNSSSSKDSIEVKSASDVSGGGSALFSSQFRFIKPGVKEKLESYKANDWVFGAVDLRAEVFADIEIKLFRRNAKNEKVEVRRHKALDMLKRPNPFITTFELFEVTSIHLDTVGQSFWLIDKDANQIWWLPPQNVSIVPDPVKFIKGYKFTNGKHTKEYSPDEILHFRKPDPSDLYGSVAPMDACARTFNLDQQATEWNWKFFKNGASSSVILFFKQKFAKGVFRQFVNKYRDAYEGSDNAQKTQFLEHEVGKVDLDRGQKDMQFAELQEKTRDRLLGGGFRVSKALLGLDENSNRATIDGAQYGFRAFVNRPRLRRVFAKINSDYLAIFGDYHGQTLCFEFEDTTPQDEELRLKRRDSDIDKGVISVNEARDERGLEPVVGGEVPRVPASSIRIDEVSHLANNEEKKDDPKKKDVPVQERKGFKRPVKSRVKKAYLKRFKGNEIKLANQTKKYFINQEKEVLLRLKKNAARLKKGYSVKSIEEDIIGNAKEEENRSFRQMFPIILALAETEGQSAISELGLSDDYSIRKIRARLSGQTQRFARKITESTFKLLKEEINLSIQNGESEIDVSKRVKSVFKNAKTYRAKTIARTQVNEASNLAHKDAYDKLNVPKREWVAAEDSRTRPGHASADGQVVGKDIPFKVARNDGTIEELDYPSDPIHGSADNIINCRCRTVAAFDD